MKRTWLILLISAVFLSAHGQTLVLPDGAGWDKVEEGKPINFIVRLSAPSPGAKFSLEGGAELGMNLDSLGNFSWTPSFDLVDRIALQKPFSVIFQATLSDGQRLRQPANFVVFHVNRPPVAEELPVFYVRQGIPNHYHMQTALVFDPDGDPIIAKPVLSTLPEGAKMTSLGLINWAPSRTQFNNLRANPIVIEATIQDQPGKLETVAKILVKVSQQDLPPTLYVVPGDSLVTIRENEVVYLKVYVTDPNGDASVAQVDFVSSDISIARSVFKENSQVQREFTWLPGYDYVDDVVKKKEVTFTFFAIDDSHNRVQRKVKVTVIDTENVEQKDQVLAQKYLQSMSSACQLLDLLDKSYDNLEKQYRKARKGKKNRTVMNASLGAVTGISPLVLPADQSKTVSVIGGTSVLTLNSLEAGQVIGKNSQEYQNQIKTNRDLRNQLQLKGNYFARKYALKSNRRANEFELDRDDLSRLINSEAVASLKLPADRLTPPSGKDIQKKFVDFSVE